MQLLATEPIGGIGQQGVGRTGLDQGQRPLQPLSAMEVRPAVGLALYGHDDPSLRLGVGRTAFDLGRQAVVLRLTLGTDPGVDHASLAHTGSSNGICFGLSP